MPDKDTTFEEYTTIELLSVSMLIVISTFALDFIHSDRSIFKIVDLDEAYVFKCGTRRNTSNKKFVLDVLCRRLFRYTILWGRIKGKSEKQYRLNLGFPFY